MRILVHFFSVLVIGFLILIPDSHARIISRDSEIDTDPNIAIGIAKMMSAARLVISNLQPTINDPKLGNKGFDGADIMGKIIPAFNASAGYNFEDLNHDTHLYQRLEELLYVMRDLVNKQRPYLDKKGLGYKDFGPDEFAKLVSKIYADKTKNVVQIHVTTSYHLLRSIWNRPDSWERNVINKRIQGPFYPKGKPIIDDITENGKPAIRLAYPEYFESSCLSCHGTPKGEKDISGNKREGARPGDFAGIISVTLIKNAPVMNH